MSLFPSGIDWEQWLGVRGAAVLGGAVLALAGLFFFRYSIEHGLIPPWLRVLLGIAVGVGALAGAEWSLRQRYAGTANALAGGGLVILYAAFWAAGNLYDLIGPGAVFLLMVAVTVTGCALSWRHESLVIAVIGLVGGFLTPLFAASDADRPIGLFGYLLLLDAAILAIARRKRWPVLALLGVAGTALYQMLWIGGRMGAGRTLLGLAILALFALLFVVAAPRADEERLPAWRWSQRAAILLPFAFALYVAGNAHLAVGILPLAALFAILGIAAGWLAHEHGEGRIALGAAAATVVVVGAWTWQQGDLGPAPWRTTIAFVLLAAAQHVAVERARADEERGPRTFEPIAGAATIVALGLLALLVVAGWAVPLSLWPLLAGWLGIAAILMRQGTLPGRGRVQVAAAVGVGLGLALYRLGHSSDPLSPELASPAMLLATTLALAVAWQAVAVSQAGLASRAWAEHAAAALALVLLLSRLDVPDHAPIAGLGVAFALGFLVLLAATRLGGGRWMLAGVAATALVHFAWTMDVHPYASLAALALALASSIAFSAWPALAAGRLRDDAWAWRAAALAGPLWFPALLVLFEDRFGDRATGLLPLLLGAVALAVAARARDLWPADHPRRTSALAWLCGVALGFATVAIPLQLDRQWITIGWALEGVALIALWTRLDHPGLKYTALALLGAATVRLVANPEVLAYYPRPEWRIVNWIAYAYLVPAAALVLAGKLLRPLEVERLRDWERPLYVRVQPLGAAAAGLAALIVVFAWLNLAIADWFSSGGEIELAFGRMPARNLTTSIVWAVYAVALLALGIRLASSALRWASLVLLMMTIAKIFLFDLGELRDLYLVASLLGLAISLLLVSLVYQRFVFRRTEPEAPA